DQQSAATDSDFNGPFVQEGLGDPHSSAGGNIEEMALQSDSEPRRNRCADNNRGTAGNSPERRPDCPGDRRVSGISQSAAGGGESVKQEHPCQGSRSVSHG